MLEFMLAGAILCGFLAGLIANNRGANPIVWFLLGFFLGPFGMLASLFSDRHRRCPECAEMVRVDAIKCKHCGASLSNRPANQPSQKG
jgi:hypothetical protein